MRDTLELMLDPRTIRQRSASILEEALTGGTAFSVHFERLEPCLDFVLEVTARAYPDGRIPQHGRSHHFRAGGIDRLAQLQPHLPSASLEQARSLVDLVVVAVLLGPGAGEQWRYLEAGVAYPRSEGLALATLAMFQAGAFSGDGSPRVDIEGLARLTVDDVRRGFQVTRDNPLLAVEGRTSLLTRLAASLEAFEHLFPGGRPGSMLDLLLTGGAVSASAMLRHVLLGFSRVWPPRVIVGDVGFGDVWLREGELVPFHLLSQWLTYSLMEPMERAGVRVEGAEALTGLPEYRNGGLFLDAGVLALRDPAVAVHALEAEHPVIVEWRALTVQLLDRLTAAWRSRRALGPGELPLSSVLQCTWSAGRELARLRRPAGAPPLTLRSDGMVF